MFYSSQMYITVNSLALGRFGCNVKLSIFKLVAKAYAFNIFYEIALHATETKWWYVNTVKVMVLCDRQTEPTLTPIVVTS